MSMLERPELSVIVPLYNEAATVAGLFEEIREVMDSVGRSYEMLAVDDGSADGTAAALATLPFVRTLTHPYSKGNGAAVKTGLRHAVGRWVVLLDGDGQHDPKDIPALLKWTDTHELVVGSRTWGSPQSWARRLANRFYNALASYVAGHRVEDLTSGFRVARREVLARFLPLLPNGFSYPATSTLAFLKSGFSVSFVQVTMRARVGQSKVAPLRDGVGVFLLIVKTTALFSPLRVFTPVSLASLGLGVLHALYKMLLLDARYTMLSVLFVTTGVLIFFIGLVSEQIAMLRFEQIQEDR